MARMKDMLTCEIEMLARMSGYDVAELMDIYFDVSAEFQEAGEPFDANFFVQVTMEHDW